jgi:hypothetical protein
MNPSLKTTELLHHLSNVCGSSLSLDNGVCALYMGGRDEAATLECPPGATQVFVHRAILGQRALTAQTYELVLRMNFEANAMRGCWLAMDAYNTLRLCTQFDPLTLNGHQFEAMLTGFITLGQELEAVLK